MFQNSSLADGRVELVVNDDNTLGYKLDGADTVYPFKSHHKLTAQTTITSWGSSATYVFSRLFVDGKQVAVAQSPSYGSNNNEARFPYGENVAVTANYNL